MFCCSTRYATKLRSAFIIIVFKVLFGEVSSEVQSGFSFKIWKQFSGQPVSIFINMYLTKLFRDGATYSLGNVILQSFFGLK